eukprot:1887625-Amphidinium_carterae.1
MFIDRSWRLNRRDDRVHLTATSSCAMSLRGEVCAVIDLLSKRLPCRTYVLVSFIRWLVIDEKH